MRFALITCAACVLAVIAVYALGHLRGEAQENELKTATESHLLSQVAQEENERVIIQDYLVVHRTKPAGGGSLYFLGVPNQSRSKNVWVLLNPEIEPVLMQQPLGESFYLSVPNLENLIKQVPMSQFVREELTRRASSTDPEH